MLGKGFFWGDYKENEFQLARRRERGDEIVGERRIGIFVFSRSWASGGGSRKARGR